MNGDRLAANYPYQTVRVSATLPRPANTTQYAAGDEVADNDANRNPVELIDCGRFKGGTGIITDVRVTDLANQTVKPNLRLYLYNQRPTTGTDNAAAAPTDSDSLSCFAAFDIVNWEVLNAGSGAAGSIACFLKNQVQSFQCSPSSTSLWFRLVERGTYTPVSAETFKVELGIVRD